MPLVFDAVDHGVPAFPGPPEQPPVEPFQRDQLEPERRQALRQQRAVGIPMQDEPAVHPQVAQGEELGFPQIEAFRPTVPEPFHAPAGVAVPPIAVTHVHLCPDARVHDIVADFFERTGNGPVVAGQIAGAGLHEGAVFAVEDIHGPVLRQPAAVGAVNPRRPVREERGPLAHVARSRCGIEDAEEGGDAFSEHVAHQNTTCHDLMPSPPRFSMAAI